MEIDDCARIKNVVLMDFRFDLKKVLSFGTVVMMGLTTIAQKTTTSVQQMWFSYNNQTRLADKWALWGDFHLRTKEDFVDDLSTVIARVGIMYYLKDNTKLTAGYAFINHFPAD